MRKSLPAVILFFFLFSVVCQSFAQTEKFGFAVTDMQKEGKNWLALRKIDFKSGNFSDVLLNGTDKKIAIHDLKGKRFVTGKINVPSTIDPDMPFVNGVAAMAYDRASNRIFYVPMYLDQLRYVDLKTMQVFTAGNSFGTNKEVMETQTRMVVAGDGYGYSISTDGSHFYRFNTVGVPMITDLGALKDAEQNSNDGMSVLGNPCMTAGGDMIADDDNNIYLIAARNYVYKISINDRMATYLGSIKNLPKNFTSNGAAVDHEGKIIITSSVFPGSMFRVDPITWEAEEYKGPNGVFNSSDLASSNLLVTNKAKKGPAFVSNMKGTIKVFPNPVRTSSFQVGFSNMEAGDYVMELTDVVGRRILQKKINISSGSFIESITLPGSSTKGIYMVRLVNAKSKQVSIEKVLVERFK